MHFSQLSHSGDGEITGNIGDINTEDRGISLKNTGKYKCMHKEKRYKNTRK